MLDCARIIPCVMVLLPVLAGLAVAPVEAGDDGTVEGALIANGKTIELPHVYVWKQSEGFYDAADPTWTLLFVERALEPRELGDSIWDAAWVEIGVTETAEFSDEPELQVYSQSLKLAADASGNISGGDYPEIELEGMDTDMISGRVWHSEPQAVFDDTFQYDFTFRAALSDPDAPIGDPLPDGGGEPGEAYRTWVKTIHAADLEMLKSIVPPEMAAQLDAVSAEEARTEIESMQLLTPTEVEILGGSSDGEIAILEVRGGMEGETITAEVTMTRMGEFWIPTGFSLQ